MLERSGDCGCHNDGGGMSGYKIWRGSYSLGKSNFIRKEKQTPCLDANNKVVGPIL